MNRDSRLNARLRIAVGAAIHRSIGRALGLAFVALLWATPLWAQATQVVEYYHTDALGSVRAVTKAGAVVSRHDFMPFGEEVQPTIPPPDKRLFTGKERDSEVGTDYLGARSLASGLGRFQAPDRLFANGGRLTDPQSLNRYAYARNNPVKYVDPDGQSYLLYNRFDRNLYLFDKDGNLKDTFKAFNNVEPGYYEIRDGDYTFEDTDAAYFARGSENPEYQVDGAYGPYGIFRLNPFTGDDNRRHEAIGIHSGRLAQGGYTYWTHGCIRTTDEAMKAISDLAATDPLSDLYVATWVPVVRVKVTITITIFFIPGTLIPFTATVSVEMTPQ